MSRRRKDPMPSADTVQRTCGFPDRPGISNPYAIMRDVHRAYMAWLKRNGLVDEDGEVLGCEFKRRLCPDDAD